MIVSMTGYSSTILALPKPAGESGSVQQINLSITLKTLNSRFFELNCKLPYSLSFLETELIKYFKSKLHRGNINFNIHMSDSSALTGTIEPSLGTIQAYLSSIERMKVTFSIAGQPSIDTLVMLPNVFQTKESPLNPEIIEEIMKAIYIITENCVHARIKEGQALAMDLKRRIEVIQECLNSLEPRAKVFFDQKKEQLFAHLATVMKDTNQEAVTDSQTTLIYNQLEKIDIHEEIVRFKSHLANLLEIVTDSDEVENGKKIDFTLQELFREINTITSKCSDAQISNLAITIKVELEKAREQAQNIV